MGLLVAGNNPAAVKTAERNIFTATAGQTTFTITQGYQAGDIDVFLNGVRLVDTEDYVANNGTTVVLNIAAAVGDSVVVVCFRPFQVADFYTKSEQDTRYVNAAGDSMTGVHRHNSYLSIGKGPANNDQITWNAIPDNAGNYTPQWTGNATAGGTIMGMPSGGNGGLEVRTLRFGTNSAAQAQSAYPVVLSIDDAGKTALGGATGITGAKLTARQGGLSCTNNANELSGYIVFNARIQSGTNFVIATATGINSESMITAKVQYINIYDWSNSTIFHHGSRMAAIRSSSGGGTTAATFSLGSQNSGSASATEPTFAWTGTTTLNLNLTGASSNEGVAVVSIAWRGCSIAISPST